MAGGSDAAGRAVWPGAAPRSELSTDDGTNNNKQTNKQNVFLVA